MGLQCYLIVFLICIFMMTIDVEHPLKAYLLSVRLFEYKDNHF
jgi:hypothetical protein